jgi:hypothetical protein
MARKTPSAKIVTSRSLTISTANFCFDLTWRKVEIELPSPPLTRLSPAPRPAHPNFAETLERKQISQLLRPPPETLVTAQSPPLSLGPLAGPGRAQVCDCYRRAARLIERDSDEP